MSEADAPALSLARSLAWAPIQGRGARRVETAAAVAASKQAGRAWLGWLEPAGERASERAIGKCEPADQPAGRGQFERFNFAPARPQPALTSAAEILTLVQVAAPDRFGRAGQAGPSEGESNLLTNLARPRCLPARPVCFGSLTPPPPPPPPASSTPRGAQVGAAAAAGRIQQLEAARVLNNSRGPSARIPPWLPWPINGRLLGPLGQVFEGARPASCRAPHFPKQCGQPF